MYSQPRPFSFVVLTVYNQCAPHLVSCFCLIYVSWHHNSTTYRPGIITVEFNVFFVFFFFFSVWMKGFLEMWLWNHLKKKQYGHGLRGVDHHQLHLSPQSLHITLRQDEGFSGSVPKCCEKKSRDHEYSLV